MTVPPVHIVGVTNRDRPFQRINIPAARLVKLFRPVPGQNIFVTPINGHGYDCGCRSSQDYDGKVGKDIGDKAADAFDRFQLLGRHIRQSFHRAHTGGDAFLEHASPRPEHSRSESKWRAAECRHLLLDLLPLLFLALDVDLPSQQLRRQANVLAFLADGERKLRVIDDYFKLLIGQIGNADAADLGRLQGLLGKGRDLS